MGKTKEEGLRVLALKLQNLRNIEIVEVDFRNRTFVEVRGKNGSAKTTLIDGIFGAVVGAKHFGKSAWRVIKQGKDKALMKVVIGNEERQIEIRRSITKKTDDKGIVTTGGSLLIKDTEGGSLGQSFLNGLLSEFTANPLAFAKKQPKEQIEIVKQLGGINTDKIEAAYDATFQERTIENRELKRLDGLIKNLRCEPAEPVKMEDLFAERQEISNFNNLQDERERAKAYCRGSIKEQRAYIAEFETEMQRMRDQLKIIEAKKTERMVNIKAAETNLKNLREPEDHKTYDAIDLAVASASKVNENAENYRQFQDAAKRQKHSKKTAEGLTAKLKDLEKEKKNMILNSKLPFKNIEFNEDVGIIINSIPFIQKSSAEKLRIGTRIGIEMKPALEVLFIEGGSLMDEESFEVVKEMSQLFGYQILVESVGEEIGDDRIVLRAGSVVSAFEHKDTKDDKMRKLLDGNL